MVIEGRGKGQPIRTNKHVTCTPMREGGRERGREAGREEVVCSFCLDLNIRFELDLYAI